MPTDPVVSADRIAVRHSLRFRLPLVLAGLILLALGVFLWLAFREVEASHLRAGGQRAQAAADQLAGLFERSVAQGMEQMRALAADPAILDMLGNPRAETLAAARARIASLPSVAPRRIEVWAANGSRLLSVWVAPDGSTARELPESDGTQPSDAMTLQALDDTTVFSDVALAIRSSPAVGGVRPRLVVRTLFSINPPGIIGQLVGTDAVVSLGSSTGGTWTDLSRVVAPPAVDLTSRGIREYRANSEPRIGAVAPIRGTGLVVWVEFPRSLVVAPAREFLRKTAVLALGFALGATVLVAILVARITKPLHDLAEASAQLGTGDYSRRVETGRRDEIGQLARAFNRMAGEIDDAYGALKTNHDQTQFALAAAHMGVWQIDLASDAIKISETMPALFGLPATDTPSRDALFELIHAGDRARVGATLAQAVDRAQTEIASSFRVVWPDGSVHWLDARARVLYDAGGRARSVLGVLIDVTRQIGLEEQLRQSQKLEAIGQLAGGIAHDFNNLLTAILGFSELLLESFPPGDPQRELLAEVRTAATRGSGLTKQLLMFSRRQILEPTVINLNTLIGETTQMLRRLIGERIRLVTTLRPDLDPILADGGRLEQVLINLVVNARDAMPQGGTLSIETANVTFDDEYVLEHVAVRPGRYVVLAVSDTGIGMSPETKARLFEPFFTTKERGRGTGLGLATVYGIVKQSNGYIWVYSEPGQGATFKVYLPRTERAASLEQPEVVDAAAGGTETLMLVEDDDAIRDLGRQILERAGYRVIEAPNSDVAERLFNDRIALLITDVVMPGRIGPVLFQALAARKPTLRVLYTSGYTDDMITLTGTLNAVQQFLQKPFTVDGLRRKVREVLDA